MGGKSNTPALDHFTQDLTYKARVEPSKLVIRHGITDRLIRILSRKLYNSAILVGPSGIGKTALIHSLANSIASGNVPTHLRDRRLIEFDMTAVVAGTKYRGQVEERIRAMMDEVARDPRVILVFEDVRSLEEIGDDAHFSLWKTVRTTVVKHLVPCIATATPELYRQFQETTAAKHFVPIIVEPATHDETIQILTASAKSLSKHFDCDITDGAFQRAAKLAEVYLPNHANPSASLMILDEAGSILALRRTLGGNEVMIQKQKDLEQLASAKDEAIKAQDFETASSYRDEERALQREIIELGGQLRKELRQRYASIDAEIVTEAMAALLGISPEDVTEGRFAPAPTGKLLAAAEVVPEFERLQAGSILQGNTIAITPGLAFVLIPHSDEFRAVYDHAIRPAIEANGLRPLKAEDIYQPGSILAQVWKQIRSAELIVADVSGKNPNVIYELGLCYGIQRCPILLVQDPSDLPFNLRNLRYIQYEGTVSGTARLRERLANAVQEFLAAVRTSADLFESRE